MNRIILLFVIGLGGCFAISGCSTITIEPREGKLPEVKIQSKSEHCKWKPKVNLRFSEKELHFECEWIFQS